jgi:hypothetical protein
MPKLEIHRGEGEWSALYVDGKLDRVGDHYLAEERVMELSGVTIVQDDAFLRGGDGVDRGDGKTVAQTLDEVNAYAAERSERQARAKRLRERAADLVHKASLIEKGEVL